MSLTTQTLNEALLVGDKIDPANYAANTYTSTGMHLKYGARAQYTVQLGVITGAATLDGNLQSATNANFSDAANITGSNITQVTNSGANCVVRLEVRADQLQQITQGDVYVRLRLVLGTNAAFLSATGITAPLYSKPAITNSGLNTSVLLQSLTT